MNRRPGTHAPAHYELRVEGHLDEHWATWFGGLTLVREDDGTTTLRGVVTDQAELHGLLAKVRDLGATSSRESRPDATTACGRGLPRCAHDQPARRDHLAGPHRPADDSGARPRTTSRRPGSSAGSRVSAAGSPVRPPPSRSTAPSFEDPDSLAKTLVVQLDSEVIGDLMLQVDDAWAQAEVAERARGVQAELGWVLHPDYAGHGYATEAVRELIRICFEDLGLRRVTASCFAANEASWRLMERVGMRREVYTVRESLHRSGSGSTAWVTRCLPTSGAPPSGSRGPDAPQRPSPPPGLVDQGDAGAVGEVEVRRGVEHGQVGRRTHAEVADVGPPQSPRAAPRGGGQRLCRGQPHLADGQRDAQRHRRGEAGAGVAVARDRDVHARVDEPAGVGVGRPGRELHPREQGRRRAGGREGVDVVVGEVRAVVDGGETELAREADARAGTELVGVQPPLESPFALPAWRISPRLVLVERAASRRTRRSTSRAARRRPASGRSPGRRTHRGRRRTRRGRRARPGRWSPR